ncbi:MAG: bacillithiol system redox-active protein YtxJ [Limnohabitans sp.]|nr:bacillithiol system redox-active protein YtxJ [Limnohabitans sp.]
MSFLKNIFGGNEPQNEGSKVNWNQLTELKQLDEIVQQSKEKPVLIFKHSTRCIISKTVLKNFEKDFGFGDAVISYYLDLLEYRPISNEIASVFNVTHQSPQLLVIKDGVCISNASHDSILDIDFNQLLK